MGTEVTRSTPKKIELVNILFHILNDVHSMHIQIAIIEINSETRGSAFLNLSHLHILQSFGIEQYLIKVIPETRRAH